MPKSKAGAITSFIFALTFWIPLINLIFGALAIIIGFRALYNIKKKPDSYGGRWLAIAGISIGFLVCITYLTGLGLCFAGYKGVCKAIGLTFLS